MEIFLVITLIIMVFILRKINNSLLNIQNSLFSIDTNLSDLNNKLSPPNTNYDDLDKV